MAQAGQGLTGDAGFEAREAPGGGLESAEREALRYFPGQAREDWQRVLEAMPGSGLGPVGRLGYLRGSPACARALGPEAAIRLGEAGMALARGAGEQAALALFMQAPKAARILGAVAPFRSWLAVLESMAPRAPESMHAVLARMEGLLERLDVRALEAWILGGIRSAGGDPASRQRYFGFADPRAEQWLAREAGEAELSSVEARLKLYLMALWRMRSPIRRAVAPEEGAPAPRRASFDNGLIRMPESFHGSAGQSAELVYRACAAHISAHFVFGKGRFKRGSLRPMQVVLVSLLEDARVEHLAMRVFPGLAALWRPMHTATASDSMTAPALMARLARALIDPGYEDPDDWVNKGRTLFYAERDRWEDPLISRTIGGLLGNDLGQMRIQLNARTYVVEPAYRDDSQGLWDLELPPNEPPPMEPETITESVRIERVPEDARPGDSAVKVEVVAPDEGVPIARYPEWDYEIGRDRPEWTTVLDFPTRAGSLNVIERVLDSHGSLVHRITRLVAAARISRPTRLRRQPEGERIDIDACIEAAISLRRGETPDPRVHMTETRRHRDLAVSLLLDVSASTRDLVLGVHRTVISLVRDAAIVLAHAMNEHGDPLAIRAFCSNGRQEVRILRIKDFGEPYAKGAMRRLAGIEAGLSTRLGAALRHAGSELSTQGNHRRLLLVITDGEPSDIDVTDRTYLVEDARKAVASLSHPGVDVFCVGLDSGGESYLHRIFGHRNVLLIDHLERLPEQLSGLYFRLMK